METLIFWLSSKSSQQEAERKYDFVYRACNQGRQATCHES